MQNNSYLNDEQQGIMDALRGFPESQRRQILEESIEREADRTSRDTMRHYLLKLKAAQA